MINYYFIELLILLALIFLSACFSSSETAITSIGRIKVEELREKKRGGSRALGWLKENPSMMLATILVGNNLVNISASALATTLSISALAGLGLGGVGAALGAAIGIMTFLILVFGEIIPKTVAIRNAEKLALIASPIIKVLSVFLYPLVKLLIWISTPFVLLFGGKMPKRGPFLTIDEIKMLLSIGEREGIIEEEEREMISSIFEFGKTAVHEVMTPRPDMQCAEIGSGIDKTISLIIAGGHSRIPVYEGGLDNIIGVVYAKDLLKAKSTGIGDEEVRGMLRPALFIPEGKRVDDLLHEMQAARTHIAIVVDEYGGVAGLVTLEDLIEEVVGEIYDEFEKKVKAVEKIDKNSTILDARMSISDVNELLKTNIPKGDYDTLGGFIFGLLGKVPAVGDQTQYDNILISVERVHRRRITRAKVVKLTGGALDAEGVGG
jgi:CBS domain containing-hemolysin-like protein